MDFVTGKRLWEGTDEEGGQTARGVAGNDRQVWQQMLLSSAEQRMRRDLTYGTLSSDGQYVFASRTR